MMIVNGFRDGTKADNMVNEVSICVSAVKGNSFTSFLISFGSRDK